MLALPGLLLAWTAWEGVAPPPPRLTYAVAPAVCPAALASTWSVAALAWSGAPTCAWVSAAVHEAFGTWQANANVTFAEVGWSDAPDVRVAVADEAVSARLAEASPDTREITLDPAACWYADRAFCHAAHRDAFALYAGLGAVWVCGLASAGWLCRKPPQPRRAARRLLAWTAALAPPLLYAALLPCLVCADLAAALAHEVGHVLGLGHSDDAARRCGCGAAAGPCEAAAADAIMHSRARHRGDACLRPDDVDGARTLVGGDCDAIVRCYAGAEHAGYARAAIAVLYAVAAAWLVLGARDWVARRADARARTAPTRRPDGARRV